MTDSLSQYCPNCEAQANTIEELRAANERWVIAFNQAEERAIEQHEAYKQDVSDALLEYYGGYDNASGETLERFIIPKPVDPLVEAWIEATGNTVGMEPLNEALAKRGLKIVEDV